MRAFSCWKGLWRTAGLLLALGPPVAAQFQPTYVGRAFVVSVRHPIGTPIVVSDTGRLPPQGGVRYAAVETFGTSEASGEVLVASSIGMQTGVRSSASIGNLRLLNGLPAEVRADFVRAEAGAECDGGKQGSEIEGLFFAGIPIQVTGEVDQTINVPGVGTLVINEQDEMHQNLWHRDMVNALHLTVPGVVEVIVAHADAGMDCPPPGAQCFDFVTGGGFILNQGQHVNFGFNAGVHSGSTTPIVQFNLVDHSTGMHMHATSITVYSVGATSTTRHLEGNCKINGASGYTYSIDVADNAEPGVGYDTISVSLSNGYSVGDLLAGGNIQLHVNTTCP